MKSQNNRKYIPRSDIHNLLKCDKIIYKMRPERFTISGKPHCKMFKRKTKEDGTLSKRKQEEARKKNPKKKRKL